MAGKSKANGAAAGNGWGGPRANSGGARAGAGKPKGSHSAKTLRKQKALARAAAKKLMPIEFMLREMRNPAHPLPVRLELAKWVAPYVSPRLSSVEVVKSIRAMSREELEISDP